MIKFIDYQLVSYNEMKHLKHMQNYRVRAVFYISYFSNHDRSKMKHASVFLFGFLSFILFLFNFEDYD